MSPRSTGGVYSNHEGGRRARAAESPELPRLMIASRGGTRLPKKRGGEKAMYRVRRKNQKDGREGRGTGGGGPSRTARQRVNQRHKQLGEKGCLGESEFYILHSHGGRIAS